MEKSSVLTGRQLMLLVVIGLHALAIGGLMTMRIVVDAARPPAAFKAVTTIDDPTPPPQPPPVLEPGEIVPTWVVPSVAPPLVPMNEITWSPPDLGPITAPGPDADPSVATRIPDIAPTPLQYRATRSPDDYYPATSMRLQEQGTAVVRVCVGPTGRIDGAPTIESGSGSTRLDAAAVKWASEALAFTPATRNGAAVSACKGFRVHFNLK